VMPVRPADPQPPPSSVTGGDSAVPVIEADVPAVDIPMVPSPGEPGAHEFGRDLAVWTSRLFDQQVKSLRYRENPADHRPCPRARTYEIFMAVAGRPWVDETGGVSPVDVDAPWHG
jgi:hypothetical protein